MVEVNEITQRVIGAAIEVHRALGPGLLESAYEACLAHEFAEQGIGAQCQLPVPFVYKGVQIPCGYRVDFVVEGAVIVEVKAVDRLARLHEAQLLSYLRISGLQVGLLINFNVPLLTAGIRRLVHGLPEGASGA